MGGEAVHKTFLFLLITLFISTLFELVASSYLHCRRKESILIYSQTKLALFAPKAFWGWSPHRGNRVDFSQGWRQLLAPWDRLMSVVAAEQDETRPHNATRSSHRYVPMHLVGQSWMPVWTAFRAGDRLMLLRWLLAIQARPHNTTKQAAEDDLSPALDLFVQLAWPRNYLCCMRRACFAHGLRGTSFF